MALGEKTGEIWMDGKWVPGLDAKVSVLTHTLHYGCGVFEGVRAYKTDAGPALFRVKEHTQRLLHSARILRLKVPYSFDVLVQAQCDVVRRNRFDSCYLRPLVWLGDDRLGLSSRGIQVHAMVAAWPFGAYLGDAGLENGIRVKISSYTRHHVNTTMTRAKAVGNYANSVLANFEATEDGYEEALLLDPSGFVCEGPGENFFMVRDGVVCTPDLSSGALNGITRQTLIQLCAEQQLPVVEKRITRDDVYIADEAFFTGTGAEVTPIREVDRVTIGNGGRGPITARLQAAYFDLVGGRTERHREWLTFV